MRRFLMRLLLPASKASGLLLLLVLISCAASREGAGERVLPEPYAALAPAGLVYDAAFSYKDFSASGLLVIKRQSSGKYVVALLSKFGPTIMEFVLEPEGIEWKKSFEQLEDKKVEKLLERDFRVLLLTPLDKPVKVRQRKTKFSVKGEPNLRIRLDSLNRVVYAANKALVNPVKTIATFTYKDQDVPQQIFLRHKNVKMNLSLNLLRVIHAEK